MVYVKLDDIKERARKVFNDEESFQKFINEVVSPSEKTHHVTCKECCYSKKDDKTLRTYCFNGSMILLVEPNMYCSQGRYKNYVEY